MPPKRPPRRAKFLPRKEAVLPWAQRLAVIESVYPKGERGRPPIGLERLRRVYFLQPWYGLAAEGVPAAPGLLNFRRWLETPARCKGLCTAINADLTARGRLLRAGMLVAATLIAAPASPKNQEKKRAPERHQTRKGQTGYFGMKAPLGADRDSKLVNTVVAPAANVADRTPPVALRHGEEPQIHAAAGYPGVEKRAEIVALERLLDWPLARQRGPIKAMAEGEENAAVQASEKSKASVRAFAEQPFHILKNLFRHRTVRYRGRAKNGHQRYTLCGPANVGLGARPATA